MDSGQDPSQGAGGDKPHGHSFSKFVRRTSKLLKSSKSNRDSMASESGSPAGESSRAPRGSTSASAVASVPVTGPTAALPSASTAPVNPPAVIAQAVSAARPKTSATSTARRAAGPKVELIRSTPTNAASHYRLQEEKARALFAKYNFALEPGEWASPQTNEREWIEKQVRIRVHRSCHRCDTSFGTEKVCQKCGHNRCKKCPRYPDKPKERREKAMMTVLVDSDPKYQVAQQKTRIVPTMMSKGGQELTRKPAQQRVRRICHKCDMVFAGRATVCAGCKHQRCPNCPREPAKEYKWTEGYPGDVEETFPLAQRTLKKIRHRVRWQCHECKDYFREKEKTCRGCKHQRCDDCARFPPKKIRPEPDPEVLRSLEEKMARTQLSPAA